MKNHSGILFDFDGVVVKSMEQHFEAWKSAFAEKYVHITSDEFFVMEGQGIDTISQIIGENHGLNKDLVNEVKERKVNYYNQYMTIEFYDYFLDMLDSLKNSGIPMGIVSGGTRDRVNKIINKYFNNAFSCIVTSDDCERGKPHPDPFLFGARLLEKNPETCIVVENAPLGIQGAKEAGMTVIAITSTLSKKYLEQADYVFNNFRDVETQLKSLLDMIPDK